MDIGDVYVYIHIYICIYIYIDSTYVYKYVYYKYIFLSKAAESCKSLGSAESQASMSILWYG